MNTKIKTVVLILITFIIPSSCSYLDSNEGISQNISSEELVGSWLLKNFVDKETNEDIYMPTCFSAKLTFLDNDSLKIFGMCNEGSAEYIVHKDRVDVFNLSITEMACKGYDYEVMFIENLSGKYVINGNILTIFSNHDKNLVLIQTK